MTRSDPFTPQATRAQPAPDPLLARLDAIDRKLGLLADAADAGPALVAGLVDSFDELVQQGVVAGVDLDDRGRRVLTLLERLTRPATLHALERLVAIVESMDATLRAAADDPPRVGLFGLLGALRDPDVQRALGAAVQVARISGRAVGSTDDPTPPALPPSR